MISNEIFNLDIGLFRCVCARALVVRLCCCLSKGILLCGSVCWGLALSCVDVGVVGVGVLLKCYCVVVVVVVAVVAVDVVSFTRHSAHQVQHSQPDLLHV